MSYTWKYDDPSGALVMFSPPDDGDPIPVGVVVNGLVAEQVCRSLEVSDPQGQLLHVIDRRTGLGI